MSMQKRICDFLLVISSNGQRISYRFQDIWRLKVENGLFSHPPLFDAPTRGNPL